MRQRTRDLIHRRKPVTGHDIRQHAREDPSIYGDTVQLLIDGGLLAREVQNAFAVLVHLYGAAMVDEEAIHRFADWLVEHASEFADVGTTILDLDDRLRVSRLGTQRVEALRHAFALSRLEETPT